MGQVEVVEFYGTRGSASLAAGFKVYPQIVKAAVIDDLQGRFLCRHFVLAEDDPDSIPYLCELL